MNQTDADYIINQMKPRLDKQQIEKSKVHHQSLNLFGCVILVPKLTN